MTAAEIVNVMPERFVPDAAGTLDAVFQFDLSGDDGGQWHVVIKDKTCNIVEGTHDAPTVTLSMTGGDFVDMMSGKLSGQAAFFSGKLRISGDLMLAQRLEGLFKRD